MKPTAQHQSSRRFRLPWRSLIIVVLTVMVLLTARPLHQSATASQNVDFRVSRLESETRSLQAQISQLESQINRLSRTTGGARTNPVVDAPAEEPPAADGTDLRFDQLATLVIETRQDMFRLEEQVEAIANQLNIPLPDATTP
ncbi:MAG: hypothetical protein VKL39_22950 [Leptolyngbyaceae bacterium]|nr:hypothetical protein [Leptolyngbyaceae bacterium]